MKHFVLYSLYDLCYANKVIIIIIIIIIRNEQLTQDKKHAFSQMNTSCWYLDAKIMTENPQNGEINTVKNTIKALLLNVTKNLLNSNQEMSISPHLDCDCIYILYILEVGFVQCPAFMCTPHWKATFMNTFQ